MNGVRAGIDLLQIMSFQPKTWSDIIFMNDVYEIVILSLVASKVVSNLVVLKTGSFSISWTKTFLFGN